MAGALHGSGHGWASQLSPITRVIALPDSLTVTAESRGDEEEKHVAMLVASWY